MPLRKVVNGAIRLNNKTFRPRENHLKYDGRLDGLKFIFIEYPTYKGDSRRSLVALWGNQDEDGNIVDGPELVDGSFPWYFWESE